MGPGKLDLLALVGKTGSIREAAEQMNMSYMRAWTLIRTMNRCFKQPLVEAVRGGKQGGGARLTATGRTALAVYRRMEKTGLAAMEQDWAVMKKLLRT
jgi:molybdate transport system regulatory protein